MSLILTAAVVSAVLALAWRAAAAPADDHTEIYDGCCKGDLTS